MFDVAKFYISRKIFLLFIIVSVICMFPSDANASSSISVNLDGKYIEFDQEPIIQAGRTLVPLRAIFEAMDMDVEWDQTTRTVTSQKNEVVITLQVHNIYAFIGTEDAGYIKVELDVPAQIINGRTMVPVRFVGEASGSTVVWNQATKTVVMTSNPDREFGAYNKSGIIDEGKTLSYVYLGYMNNDIFEGFGSQIWSNGETYVGNWENDMANGYGTYSWSDGAQYVGNLENGMKHGYGTMTTPDGQKYVGNWENDMRNGYGIKTWPDGRKYAGNYQNDLKSGYGTFTWPDGEKYVGNYKNDMAHGYGTYTWAHGDVYRGYFKNDKRDGQGTYTFSNGIKKTGLWKNDEFIN